MTSISWCHALWLYDVVALGYLTLLILYRDWCKASKVLVESTVVLTMTMVWMLCAFAVVSHMRLHSISCIFVVSTMLRVGLRMYS